MLADASSQAHDGELLVAADADDRLLGTVTIALPGTPYAQFARSDELEFRMLAVDPAARRRGTGDILVRAVLDRARDLALRKVVLSSQKGMTPAHRLYERLGFRRTPTRDWTIPNTTMHLIVYTLDL